MLQCVRKTMTPPSLATDPRRMSWTYIYHPDPMVLAHPLNPAFNLLPSTPLLVNMEPTPGRKPYPWKNVPRWSKLYDKLQQHSATPLHNQPTVEALHAGTDNLESASTEFERPPKDSRGLVTERPENSPEIPETPTVALKSMRCGDDDHSDDGNTLSHFRGHWLTETDRS
jgi:hypothetical protein